MTELQKKEAARQFYYKWKDTTGEKQFDRTFWLELLQNVFGVENALDYITFQKTVIINGHTNFIDAYISATKVLIEQKSANKRLDAKERQSDGTSLTPYEQAKRYNDNLPYDERARWIVTSNFREIWIYDLNMRVPTPIKIRLINLRDSLHSLDFLVKHEVTHISEEVRISVDAGELINKIYNAFLEQYADKTSEYTLKSLNVLCVRLVFLLYAEDAGLFDKHALFHDYLIQFITREKRQALCTLFQYLDKNPEEREIIKKENSYLFDDYPMLSAFPYVNGGLFRDDDIEIPPFTEEISTLIIRDASENFDWSKISPTIFGAIFESTLNTETRAKGGMHYTSIENIHKLIDPLFLNDLKNELTEIERIEVIRDRNRKLKAFQDKLSKLYFVDPAAGSGNFLTESFLSIRRLENRVIKDLTGGQMSLGDVVNPIKVSISQFYGIEINDFAVTVAKTALWIAESQMFNETEDILLMQMDFLPLKTNANIIEGNSLSLDWDEVLPKDKITYVIGNPPFIGARIMSKAQKDDVLNIFGKNWKNVGNLDYVCCWYKKITDFIKNTNIRAALVSTNSVSQGETVADLWKPLFDEGIHIDFAYQTFIWDSEAKQKAHVHCVIIGFSSAENNKEKVIFTTEKDGSIVKSIAKNINGYLIDSDNVFVESRQHPICNVPEIGIGNKPIDDGNYLFTEEEMLEFIKKEPESEKYFHPWYGSKEFINRTPRYCLWLGDCTPNELRQMPNAIKRVEAVREFRLKSKSPGTNKLAERPTHFHVENMPDTNYIVVPKVSSERREYIPIGFMTPDIFCSDLVFMIPNATLYHFGILESNVHMAWVNAVCGRLKSDYRYSKDVVYNNFPWPTPTEEQRKEIEKTAQGILDARAKYPDSSLADLYDPTSKANCPELIAAHRKNDIAVEKAYGFDVRNTSKTECLNKLFQMYKEIITKS
jgi:hypothetical protein